MICTRFVKVFYNNWFYSSICALPLGTVPIKRWNCCWLGYCWQHMGSCFQVFTDSLVVVMILFKTWLNSTCSMYDNVFFFSPFWVLMVVFYWSIYLFHTLGINYLVTGHFYFYSFKGNAYWLILKSIQCYLQNLHLTLNNRGKGILVVVYPFNFLLEAIWIISCLVIDLCNM